MDDLLRHIQTSPLRPETQPASLRPGHASLLQVGMYELNAWTTGGGVVIGALFAFLVQRFRFCLVASVSNVLLIKDYRQALAFAAAWLVAITGTQLLEMTGLVAIAESSYRDYTLDWFGAALGGTVFGIGAALAGGCAVRTLIRAMEGSTHSLIALVSFVAAAAVTQFGVLEPLRVRLMHATAIPLKTDAGIAAITSLPLALVLVVVIFALLFFIYRAWQRSADRTMLMVGAAIGVLVIAGWYVTGVLAQDEFTASRPASVTVSGTLARFGYALASARLPVFSFAVSFTASVAISALVIALATGRFKLTLPARGGAGMALLGGALMGVGSVLAYGCNVGQGLTGVSTLSLESLIAVAGMTAGVAIVVKWMEKYS